MYIKYELYRSKNNEMFNAEMIEWVLKEDRDLIEIDRRIRDVLATHISQLSEVKKYGTAYIGSMKIIGIEINNNDDLGGLTEKEFRSYMGNENVMPLLDIKWNKTTTNIDEQQKSVKTEPDDDKEDKNG